MSETHELAGEQLEFVIRGMSCGSCAARIERRLNRLDGVVAAVNYATERAYITSTGGREPDELISVIESVGYRAARPAPPSAEERLAADDATRMLRWRLVVCVPLALLVIVLSMVPAAQFPGWQWLCLLVAGIVALWGAWPLHQAAWAGLGHGAATMDTLVSVGVAASFGWSVYALLFGGADMAGMRMSYSLAFAPASGHTLYLDVAAGVTAAVLAGRYLEARAKRESGAALTALAGLAAKTVAVLRDETEQRVPVAELAAGERFVARPGEKIATDGVVLDGRSAVDASLVTGESMPAEVGPGDEVIGSCISMSGRLTVQATRVGADTLLAQITRLVSQAQTSKAAAQRLADRIAAVFVPAVISVAAATLGFWLGAGVPGDAAWSAAIAVLVVACPCALGLATPAALLAGVGRGAELGILVKSVQALESAQRIRIVVLDKTGTLTTGRMIMQDVTVAPGPDGTPAADEKEVLQLAGAVEDASEHPIGQAIAREAAARLGSLPPVDDFVSLPGAGVGGRVLGRDVTVGSVPLFAAGDSPSVPRCSRPWSPLRARPAPLSWSAGTARRVACWSSPTRSSQVPRMRWPGSSASACGPSCSPVITSVQPRRSPPSWPSLRRAWWPGFRRTGKRRLSASCRRPATGSRWWATGSTTPPPWPRPTWAWPSAPAPTPRSGPRT